MTAADVFARPDAPAPPLPPALAPRAFWVLPPRLLAGNYPGDIDPATARAKAAALRELGVTDIVSLMEADERDARGRPFHPYAPEFEPHGVRLHRFAIRDVTAPSVEVVTAILDHIDGALRDGGTVYVHCWGGRGRTGVVVGCWMVRHGRVDGDGAVAELNRLRAGCADAAHRAPDTWEQIQRIR